MKRIMILLAAVSVFAQEEAPWLTGPLIVANGTAVPLGSFIIQPYFYFNTKTGEYNEDWNEVSKPNVFSFNPQLFAYVGLTKWMDIVVAPQMFVNHTQGQTATEFGDFQAGLDFQLYAQDPTRWCPGVKFSVIETFPTGPYQKGNPHKLGTDIVGAGVFGTQFGLLAYNVYHLWNAHYLSLYLSYTYTLKTDTHVKGLNAYGGSTGTNAHVKVGNAWEAIFSFEFTLSQNWVLAMDTVWTHEDISTFSSGNPGIDPATGAPAPLGNPSSEQLSFAPAIEYNFSEHIGIVAGCYLSALGRNSTVFRGAIIEAVFSY